MRRIWMAVLALCLIPAAASAGEGSYVLHIFGNANMDGTIDEEDASYLEEIISGSKEPTDLSDANGDGSVDGADLDRVREIVSGEEEQLTLLDGNGLPITIDKPVERVIVEYLDNADMMQILKRTDRVVGVDMAVAKSEREFPELSKRTNVGAMYKEPDYEAILSLDPDLLLTFSNATAEKQKNLPGVPVFFAGLYYPDLLNPETSSFADGVMKLGYVLDSEEEAEDYLEWHTGLIGRMRSIAEEIPEDDRPRVLVSAYPNPDEKTLFTYSKIDPLSGMVYLAGGRGVADLLPEFLQSTYRFPVDPEWVIEQDPEYIVLLTVATTYSGLEMDPPTGYDADDPSGMRDALEAFKARPEFSNLTAVREGRVYMISGNMRNDATKGLLGAAYLGSILHPEMYGGIDPEEVHSEYLERFMGVHYDLDEGGVFIYPPLIGGDGDLEGVPDRYYDDLVVAGTAPD